MASKHDQDDPARSETVLASAPELLAARYAILGLVGRGGMGAVYRVRDTELDEIVALKVLNRELAASPELIERFRREVKLARRVTHPNVARTFDIGEHHGTRFLTMEYVDGESLSDVVRRAGRLSLRRVLEIADALCQGLAAAHAAAVVHRDLKPDNVIVARDGRIVITDFGIARDPQAGVAQTAAGGMVGTPAYMAPEQVDGSHPIDARTDVYALGVLLYELSTGELPFRGPTAIAIALSRLQANAPNPRSVRPELPVAVADVVMRCMARLPGDRFPDATAVGAALAAAAPTLDAGAPLQPSVPPPPTGQAARPSRETSVAVVPFRNQGPREDDYVADGLTDDLIDTLSMSAGLRVRPRGAVARFKGVDEDPRVIGKELAVEMVVDGSVRRAGANVRLTARLLSVEDGFQLWAQRFERPANDLLVVSDETAGAIAAALAVHATRKQGVSRDPVAVDLYLKARAELRKTGDVSTDRAIELLEEANQRAPEDIAILSAYARACARRWFLRGGEGGDSVALAERAANAAPRDADAQLALATVRLLQGDVNAAAVAGRRAFDLAPDHPDANEFCARLLLETGRPQLAVRALETALAGDAHMHNARLELVRAHALLGQYERALQVFRARRGTEPGPAEWVVRGRLALWADELRPLLDGLPDRPDAPLTSPAGVANVARAILTGTAGELMPKLVAAADGMRGAQRFATIVRQVLAEFLARLDRIDDALVQIDRSVKAGLFDLTWMDRCPVLEPLRDDPRFLAARAEVERRALGVRSALGVDLSEAD
jgi:eukaryotic-like serine/threonine-protein kinase